jgi:hypothetical protein
MKIIVVVENITFPFGWIFLKENDFFNYSVGNPSG